tara:strand:+ start:89 stop:439 length:351 start_codon:yes stop_codon:yes gene_type:complete
MFPQAVATTAALLVFSLVTKVLLETPDASGAHALELLHQAAHWREVAAQDSDPALRLQHAATASTLLNAARTLARDAELERGCGVNVPRLARKLEAAVADARQSITKVAAAATSSS